MSDGGRRRIRSGSRIGSLVLPPARSPIHPLLLHLPRPLIQLGSSSVGMVIASSPGTLQQLPLHSNCLLSILLFCSRINLVV
ncbi:unnamed protein product [Urochloa humidicola]